jgi:hypothetical protein
LRTQCGIWVSDSVIDKSGIQVEEISSESGDLPSMSLEDEQTISQASPDEMERFSKLIEGVDLSGKGGESQSN